MLLQTKIGASTAEWLFPSQGSDEAERAEQLFLNELDSDYHSPMDDPPLKDIKEVDEEDIQEDLPPYQCERKEGELFVFSKS